MTVVKLIPSEVGERFRFDPDDTLKTCIGCDYRDIAVIGQMSDGQYSVVSNMNAGELMVLLECIKLKLIGVME